MAKLYENLQPKAIRERCCPSQATNFERMTDNSDVIHLDEKRPTRAVEELHQVAATRTERRQPVKLDYLRVADNPGVTAWWLN